LVSIVPISLFSISCSVLLPFLEFGFECGLCLFEGPQRARCRMDGSRRMFLLSSSRLSLLAVAPTVRRERHVNTCHSRLYRQPNARPKNFITSRITAHWLAHGVPHRPLSPYQPLNTGADYSLHECAMCSGAKRMRVLPLSCISRLPRPFTACALLIRLCAGSRTATSPGSMDPSIQAMSTLSQNPRSPPRWTSSTWTRRRSQS